MKQLNWSEYQKLIFNNVSKGTGNTAVIARAGSAKTTSLIEAIKHIPKGKKTLVAAFSKAIADELKKRVPSYVKAATLHSLGFAAIQKKFGKVVLDNRKCFNLVKEILNIEDYEIASELVRAVGLCKSFLVDAPSKIIDIIDKYDIECYPYEQEDYAHKIIKLLAACKKMTAIIDYNDMIYFPFVYGLNIGTYDYILIDEAQDLNYAQLCLALTAAHKHSRIFVFLDDWQAIFGFTGCDIQSVNAIIDRLEPTKLSLPISYRCPQKVIKLAQELVSDIQMAPNAIEGKIEALKYDQLLNKVKGGDYIISRTNAPLIRLCLNLLKMGVPANIQGRDIGSNLTAFIKKSKAKTIEQFISYLEKWKNNEIKRLAAEKKDITVCVDKAETLSNLCDGCDTIRDLQDNIEKLFDDVQDKDKVLLGTTHRLKGKETNRVFMLEWTYRKGTGAEEDRIYYVAITRAKRELYFVNKY